MRPEVNVRESENCRKVDEADGLANCILASSVS